MTNWPHAPVHQLSEQGVYMVTAGTYRKEHHFHNEQRLNFLQDQLFLLADEFGWSLQAWAILSNHYHFIASSPKDSTSLRTFISKLHTLTAKQINEWDQTPGRKVWYQYFDTRITHQTSYYARLKYVHHNPVHHGLLGNAENYPWCSAAWFAKTARPALRRTIENFKTDRVNVDDNFQPVEIKS